MSEVIYFEKDSIKVTNSRVLVDGKTYALSGITSVGLVEQKPNRLLPIALMVVGFLFAKSNPNASIWHFMAVTMPFAIWLLVQRSKFVVQISSASGESKALVSRKREYVRGVVEAINGAIVARG